MYCSRAFLGFALFVSLMLSVSTASIAQSAHQLTLAWSYAQSATLATGFVLQRGIQQTDRSCPLTDLPGATALPVTTLTYTDSTVQAGTIYCYVVLATGAGGARSTPSNQLYWGTIDPAPVLVPLGVPTGVRGTGQ